MLDVWRYVGSLACHDCFRYLTFQFGITMCRLGSNDSSMWSQGGSPSTNKDPASADSHTVFRPPPSSETYSFEKIVTHQGPLSKTEKKYRGEPFSLKILWSTKEHTWEPLFQFFADQPDEVIKYAMKFNLLGNRHWSKIRDLAMSPGYNTPPPSAFHEEYDYAPDMLWYQFMCAIQ